MNKIRYQFLAEFLPTVLKAVSNSIFLWAGWLFCKLKDNDADDVDEYEENMSGLKHLSVLREKKLAKMIFVSTSGGISSTSDFAFQKFGAWNVL